MNRSGYLCEQSDRYLGDGVYLKWDNSYCQAWLITQEGDAIALDYPMVCRLMQLFEEVSEVSKE